MQTENLRFTAVGHYDVKGVGPAVATVVASFIDHEAATTFIKGINDAQGAEELELYVDGMPAAELEARAAARVVLLNSHKFGSLHGLVRKVFDAKVLVGAWGQVATLARILDLTASPVVDCAEDVDAICDDYVLRSAAVAIVLRQPY